MNSLIQLNVCNNIILVTTLGIILITISSSTPCLILAEAQNTSTSTSVDVNVGLVYDELEGEEGEGVLCAIEIALSDFYATHGHYKTRLVINKRESYDDVVGAAAAAVDLIENVQVQAILGPKTSMQASFMINLGEKAHVPIISFSASSPSLTSDRSPFFFRATQNDSTQVNVISAVVQAFGWRQVVAVYIDNVFGRGILPYLNDALLTFNARIAYRCPIPPQASDDVILRELYKLKTMQTRVFVLHMSPDLGSRLFRKAREAGMVDKGYIWIMTSGITDSLEGISSSVLNSMQGALGVRAHVSLTQELRDFKAKWKVKIHQENPHVLDPVPDVQSLWAHDATIALAMAVDRAGTADLNFDHRKVNYMNSTSTSNNGGNLIRALSEVNFTGLTGNFKFVDGQFPPSVYQVVNFHSDGARGVGFWTQESGLIRNLSAPPEKNVRVPSSPSSLAPIIWAGESTSVPKGWEIPTTGNKLKVGVPVKQGFLEFVNVSINTRTNDYVVSGYSIDVFKAVREALPYSLDYEFIPFAKPNSTDPAGTYDDLVDHVYQGRYEAVVGDIAIRFNRTTWVDFTLPYTESGVKMVVPLRDSKTKNAWVFLKPLTWQLWLTIACFFLWIGFVVWVLERRVNEEFLGPTLQQVSTGFWFSLSTMVFAQKERVVSNLTRMVVVVWCFVVLILSQSYTASLASLLTVQQFQPTVNELDDLIRNRVNVGYEQGSYVKGILTGLGFEESNLIMFRSAKELHGLFQLGPQNGGVAAAFDDAPCMKLFMAQYCNKYTIVEPGFQTDGFGFVFPKGSPLVSDISKAILEVKEGGKIGQIEEQWFAKEKDCPDSSTSITSTSLDVNSFLGLFIIAGVASGLALVLSIAVFVRDNKQELEPSSEMESSTSWSKVRKALKIYSGKDWKSFPANNHPRNGACFVEGGFVEGGGTGAPSPSTLSVDSDFLNRDVSARPSFEFASPSSESHRTIDISH